MDHCISAIHQQTLMMSYNLPYPSFKANLSKSFSHISGNMLSLPLRWNTLKVIEGGGQGKVGMLRGWGVSLNTSCVLAQNNKSSGRISQTGSFKPKSGKGATFRVAIWAAYKEAGPAHHLIPPPPSAQRGLKSSATQHSLCWNITLLKKH